MTSVSISRLHYPVTTLGPGRRVGVWFQGCSIRCAGCISTDTWSASGGSTTVDAVLALVQPWAAVADGLTVSGGEPFDQILPLRELLQAWRRISSANVLVFTGREYSDVAAWLSENGGLVDALVSGPFDQKVPQTKALRGSDNQQLHVLTERGLPISVYERTVVPGDRRLDVMFDASGLAWFAGIPARDDFRRLRAVLRADGNQVTFSERSRGRQQ